ncbi:uncharacterized protein BJ171DRAFT_473940 [Polychytrium aggregatum]|uniref:uncharacterized protein n=1 Tax=Polychytrium aggregatum TaxID=110093 RepID=UPI0022FDDDBE|nr:uncharacterized protein BJ171DRAFT_473940 [Polychytrium aggregatum]KAI9205931.1 hypothetical protein BJ171DRAFT_473940 [Polychytrium aggregatum]
MPSRLLVGPSPTSARLSSHTADPASQPPRHLQRSGNTKPYLRLGEPMASDRRWQHRREAEWTCPAPSCSRGRASDTLRAYALHERVAMEIRMRRIEADRGRSRPVELHAHLSAGLLVWPYADDRTSDGLHAHHECRLTIARGTSLLHVVAFQPPVLPGRLHRRLISTKGPTNTITRACRSTPRPTVAVGGVVANEGRPWTTKPTATSTDHADNDMLDMHDMQHAGHGWYALAHSPMAPATRQRRQRRTELVAAEPVTPTAPKAPSTAAIGVLATLQSPLCYGPGTAPLLGRRLFWR